MPFYKASMSAVSPLDKSRSLLDWNRGKSAPFGDAGLSNGVETDERMAFLELTEADREQEMNRKSHPGGTENVKERSTTGYWNDHELVKPSQVLNSGGRETVFGENIVEREARLQREREAEYAAMRSFRSTSKPLSNQLAPGQPAPPLPLSPPPPTLPESPPPRPLSDPVPSTRHDNIEHISNSHQMTVTSSSSDDVTVSVQLQRQQEPYGPNPGESLIFQEIQEQQRREDELRRQRKEIGARLISDNDDNRQNDVEISISTPALSKEPSPVPQPVQSSHPASVSAQQKSQPVKVNSSPSRVDDIEVSVASKANKTVPKERPTVVISPPDLTQSTSGVTPNTSVSARVRPLEDEEFFSETRLPYAPMNDSAIEREIRAAREREAALRRSRGFSTADLEDNEREKEVEISVSTPAIQIHRERSVDVFAPARDDIDSKVAKSRLKMEIQRERQRELDLRQQGAISTISEERAGEQVKYVEIISSRESAESAARELQPKNKRSYSNQSLTPSTSVAVPEVVSPPVVTLTTQVQAQPKVEKAIKKEELPVPVVTAVLESPPAISTSNVANEKSVPKTTLSASTSFCGVPLVNTRLSAPGTSDSIQSSASFGGRRKELPQVLRTFAYPYVSLEEGDQPVYAVRASRATAGLRLGQEVAEVQRREQELRQQREALKFESSLRIEPSRDIEDGSTTEKLREQPKQTSVPEPETRPLLPVTPPPPPPQLNLDGLGVTVQGSESYEALPTTPRRKLALIQQWEQRIVSATA